MEATPEVQVLLRGIVLAEQTAMTTLDERTSFVSMNAPPPVRSRVELRQSDGTSQVLEVTAVTEVAEDGQSRGFIGQCLDVDAMEAPTVGTEELDAPIVTDDDAEQASLSEPGIDMGTPAPVVDPDDDADIDEVNVDEDLATDGDLDPDIDTDDDPEPPPA